MAKITISLEFEPGNDDLTTLMFRVALVAMKHYDCEWVRVEDEVTGRGEDYFYESLDEGTKIALSI